MVDCTEVELCYIPVLKHQLAPNSYCPQDSMGSF